ncbi:MAG: glycosyltransferase, partial [Rikenellaceae bacterium]
MENQKFKIIQIFASKGWGGGEKYVLDLSLALIGDGHEVVFVSKKCPIISAKLGDGRNYYQLGMNGVKDFFSAWQLSRIIREEKPDLIHVHNFKDAFVAVYAKLISGMNARVVMSRHLIKRAKISAPYSWLYRHLDRIVFVSEIAKREFLMSGPSIDRRKITVLHNSINTPLQQAKTDLRKKYTITPSTVILAFTGRITPEKGVEVLIDAMAQMSDLDFRLLILGSGREKYMEKIKKMIVDRNLSEKITMTGFVNDVAAVISQSDIGVIPSVCPESFGLSVIEFMEQGKVVVTTDNGAQPEFIDHGVNGFLVPPSESEAIVRVLRRVIADRELLKRVGAQAKKDFDEKLDYKKFYEHITEEVYRSPIVSSNDKLHFEVLFDAEKIKNPNTGLYTFNKHLSKALYDEAIRRGHTFGVYCSNKATTHLLSVPFKTSRYLWRYCFSLNKRIRVWHAPFQSGKFFPISGQKVVLTIHDLNFLYEKKGLRRDAWLKKLQHNIDKSDYIVAISNFTKADVEKYLNVGDKPIEVIYNGYTPHEINDENIKPLTTKKFLFSMATVLPKKNFHVLPPLLLDNDYELIIAGNRSSYVREIMAEAVKYGVESRVKIVGSITENEKVWCLKHCEAFLFPSIAEGFGLPVIEAMYYQKPIFLSRHTSLPEIGMDFCYYFNYDFDTELMRKEFREGMADFMLHDRRAALRERAESFTWERAAKQYWDI